MCESRAERKEKQDLRTEKVDKEGRRNEGKEGGQKSRREPVLRGADRNKSSTRRLFGRES